MTEPEIRPYDFRLVPSTLLCWAAMVFGVLAGAAAVTILAAALGVAAAVLGVAGTARVLEQSGSVRRVVPGVVAMLALGACFAAAAAIHVGVFETSPVGRAAERQAWVSAAVTVREDPRSSRSAGPETVTVRGELRQVDIAGAPHRVGGRILVIAPADGWDDLVPGQEVTLRGQLSVPDRADLTVAVVRVDGPPTSVSKPGFLAAAAGHVRSNLALVASTSLPPDRGGLLPGLVVGDVSALPEEIANNFRAAGLTHLTAVSGANFSILLGAVLLLARGIGTGPRTTALVCALVLLIFVVIARPSPSVLRAAVMGSIGLLGLVTGRRRQAVPALCTAVLGLIAWWPNLAVDFGFALSVSATAGLVVLAPVWVDWLRRHGWGRASAEIVAVAAAAHAVTAPVVAAMSGTFSAVGVVANVAVAPLVAPITVIGAIVAVVASFATGVASLIVLVASAPLWWLISVAQWAASVPGAGFEITSGVPGAAAVVGALTVLILALRFQLARWILGGLGVVLVLFWLTGLRS
ncbi:ComEC/Rec2 family competence protein [Rhodococcus sp. 1168]|uniref:ComEC/Rec2 family competence protein n=1 Tax=Rhodococcus sp. 1168 TaxID=2018041 RepID=UPI000A0CB792|nr:ComEC/Rec2 family competence protein [Rhodococcus sp. 1168]ORI17230.1 competence protein ComEC [Rhodococcus sp. 1168]